MQTAALQSLSQGLREVRMHAPLILHDASTRDALSLLLEECRGLLAATASGTSQLLNLPDELLDRVLSACSFASLARLACTCVFLRSTPDGRGKIHNALPAVVRRVFGSNAAADNFASQLFRKSHSLNLLGALESAKGVAALWSEQGAVDPKLLAEGKELPTWSEEHRMGFDQACELLSLQNGVSLAAFLERSWTGRFGYIPALVLGDCRRTVPVADRPAFLVMALLALCDAVPRKALQIFELLVQPYTEESAIRLWGQNEMMRCVHIAVVCLYTHPHVAGCALEFESEAIDDRGWEYQPQKAAGSEFLAKQLVQAAAQMDDADILYNVLDLSIMAFDGDFQAYVEAGGIDMLLALSDKNDNPIVARALCEVLDRIGYWIGEYDGKLGEAITMRLAGCLQVALQTMSAFDDTLNANDEVRTQSLCTVYQAIEVVRSIVPLVLTGCKKHMDELPLRSMARQEVERLVPELGQAIVRVLPRLKYDDDEYSSPGSGIRGAVEALSYLATSHAFAGCDGASAAVSLALDTWPSQLHQEGSDHRCIDLQAVGIRTLLLTAVHDASAVLAAGGARRAAAACRDAEACRDEAGWEGSQRRMLWDDSIMLLNLLASDPAFETDCAPPFLRTASPMN